VRLYLWRAEPCPSVVGRPETRASNHDGGADGAHGEAGVGAEMCSLHDHVCDRVRDGGLGQRGRKSIGDAQGGRRERGAGGRCDCEDVGTAASER
jgi:hypothetical protein